MQCSACVSACDCPRGAQCGVECECGSWLDVETRVAEEQQAQAQQQAMPARLRPLLPGMTWTLRAGAAEGRGAEAAAAAGEEAGRSSFTSLSQPLSSHAVPVSAVDCWRACRRAAHARGGKQLGGRHALCERATAGPCLCC
jgi:hypothetical protein